MERKRPSSEKQHASKKCIQETSRRTRSSKGKAYKRINYCEDSSTDESADDSMLRTCLPSHATGVDNRQKEASSSSDDSNIDVDEVLQESSNSSILPHGPDLSKSRSNSPFQFWGKSYEDKRYSESDKEDKVETENEDGASARKAPNQLIKDNVNKEWEKHKALLFKKDGKKMASRPKAGNAVPGSSSSFHHERKCSVDDREYEKDGKEVEDGACKQNASKVVSNYNLEKEPEKCETLNKKLDSKEPSKSQIGDSEPGSSSFHNQRTDVLKSIKPVMHSEVNIEHKKDATEVEDAKNVEY